MGCVSGHEETLEDPVVNALTQMVSKGKNKGPSLAKGRMQTAHPHDVLLCLLSLRVGGERDAM